MSIQAAGQGFGLLQFLVLASGVAVLVGGIMALFVHYA
jgi:hypothetical protein